MMKLEKVAVVGGAGFIGSHFVDALLGSSSTQRVVIYDNFSSGRDWHFEHHLNDSRLQVVRGQISDQLGLVDALNGIETVIHLASNPDIAAAVNDPEIDFREGTALTNAVVEAMRIANVESILYASGSGVYGDIGEKEGQEDVTPMLPVSTYGASKLAGEALIGSYCYMFDKQGFAFRFGNVVGPRQTHGVGFDFVKRLLANPTELQILGDGKQSKSYIHVEDVVNAVLHVAKNGKERFKSFNVATLDYITVNEIADIAIEVIGLNKADVVIKHTGGDRGWKGDVPIVRLNTSRIRETGWFNTRSCSEAIRASLMQLLPDAQNGKI
jgi:UDP-glucose 4-epimerase